MKQLRNRKGQCLPYSERNFEAEPGDYMVDMFGQVFRLEESSGWGKRNAGELTPRTIHPPKGYSHAILKDGKIFWVKE